MNSDPKESAAWRVFGILNADEAARFDEAATLDPALQKACREMESLSTAVAIVASSPISPKNGQLEQIHRRLGIRAAAPPINWLAVVGWSVAAALALLLVFEKSKSNSHRDAPHSAASSSPFRSTPSPSPRSLPRELSDTTATPQDDPRDANLPHESSSAAISLPPERQTLLTTENKQLTREISVLKNRIQTVEQRDLRRSEPIAGFAWPVIMRMTRPRLVTEKTAARSSSAEDPVITTLLGEALVAANQTPPPPPPSPTFKSTSAEPSAVPIYDPTRDSGTLVTHNLEANLDGQVYHLWFTPEDQITPIYVGSLPKSTSQESEAFDFNFGSKNIIPSRFMLTADQLENPSSPSVENTVLSGPR